MGFYSEAPLTRPFSEDKSVLLTSWWITLMSTVVILLRLMGRLVRVERLFGEDKLSAVVLLPMFARIGLIHPVLMYGTNNVKVDGIVFSEEEIRRREMGSKLVLAGRVMHAGILWVFKLVTLAFLYHLVSNSGNTRYTYILRFINVSLLFTFLAIVISTLAECSPPAPFPHNWQVVPDPGGRCRQGYAQLVVAAVGNALTDVMLVVFPVLIIWRHSSQLGLSVGRRALLVFLFGLHLFTAAVAIYKVPAIMKEGGYQATRTMWASVEVLVATFATNVLVIGTFVRDKGIKKKKPRYEPPPVEEGVMAHHRRGGSKMKAGEWEEDSEGDDPEIARGVIRTMPSKAHQHRQNLHQRVTSGGLIVKEAPPEGGRVSRTDSRDSLIPRGRDRIHAVSTPEPDTKIIQTTTIEVTVSKMDERQRAAYIQETNGLILRPEDALVLRPEDVIVRSGSRSRAMATALPVREMQPLHADGRIEGAA